MDEQYTYASPLQNRGDDLLIEDQHFAVVYNGSVGGTYDVMLKYTEQEVRDHIRRYGVDRASEDVKALAREMAAEQFAEMTRHKMPVFEMTLDANLQGVNEQLNDLEEYREEQQEAEYSGGMRR